jgi:hypothetical protein
MPTAGTNSKQLVIIGVDPGKATGLALYYQLQLIAKNSLPADDAPAEISRWIAVAKTRLAERAQIIIAVERYQTGRSTVKKTRQTDPLELLGACRLIARGDPAITVVVANASDAKRIASPATLKRIGWWTAGHDHINDATCQIIRTLAAVRPLEFAELIGL